MCRKVFATAFASAWFLLLLAFSPLPAFASPLTVTTTSLPSATVGVGYGQGLTATGGVTPYTWSVSSGLPPGLAINASAGSIYGTPTAAGTFSFTVTVRDNSSPQQTASQGLSITVTGGTSPLTVTTTSLPSATVGVGYGQGLTATGGVTPYTWSVSSDLPPGLAINASAGSIYGTPTAAGTFSFTVTVRDNGSSLFHVGVCLRIGGARWKVPHLMEKPLAFPQVLGKPGEGRFQEAQVSHSSHRACYWNA